MWSCGRSHGRSYNSCCKGSGVAELSADELVLRVLADLLLSGAFFSSDFTTGLGAGFNTFVRFALARAFFSLAAWFSSLEAVPAD